MSEPRNRKPGARSPASSLLHLEGRHECVDLVIAPELSPRTVTTRLGHQPIENHVGPAAQLLEICSGWDEKPRHLFVVIAAWDDVERVGVDVLVEILAHDEGVPKGAEICLEVGYGIARTRIGQ